MDKVVGSRFRLVKKIGSGSFGQIYLGEDKTTQENVAVKLEPANAKIPQLSYESKLYMLFSGSISVPRLIWYGSEVDYNIMTIDLLGKSLEDLFSQNQHKFSLKTVLMLADQMISAVEYMHNKNFIHRDIKPDNFLIGRNSKANQVFIIDFGLAKKYRDTTSHIHIPFTDGKSLTGTARYASVNALRGMEQSRRDDMESLGFVWLYMLRGTLPWMGLDAKDRKTKYERICSVKAKTKFDDLCRGFPIEFVEYFNDVRQLRFTDTPNYSYYKQLFRELFIRQGYLWDYQYDWSLSPTKTNYGQPLTKQTSTIYAVNSEKSKKLISVQSANNLLESEPCSKKSVEKPLPLHRSRTTGMMNEEIERPQTAKKKETVIKPKEDPKRKINTPLSGKHEDERIVNRIRVSIREEMNLPPEKKPQQNKPTDNLLKPRQVIEKAPKTEKESIKPSVPSRFVQGQSQHKEIRNNSNPPRPHFEAENSARRKIPSWMTDKTLSRK